MKKVMLLSTLFLIGAGCSSATPEEVEINEVQEMIPENTELNPNEVPKAETKPTVDTAYSSYSGSWSFENKGNYVGGVEATASLSLNLTLKTGPTGIPVVVGNYTGTLSTKTAPAMRVIEGTVHGFQKDGRFVFDWDGVDGEEGSGLMKLENGVVFMDISRSEPNGRDFSLGDFDEVTLTR